MKKPFCCKKMQKRPACFFKKHTGLFSVVLSAWSSLCSLFQFLLRSSVCKKQDFKNNQANQEESENINKEGEYEAEEHINSGQEEQNNINNDIEGDELKNNAEEVEEMYYSDEENNINNGEEGEEYIEDYNKKDAEIVEEEELGEEQFEGEEKEYNEQKNTIEEPLEDGEEQDNMNINIDIDKI